MKNMTLKRMAAKLRAEEDERELRKWCRKHPNSPEALRRAQEAQDKAVAKALAKIERETRREARMARPIPITGQWLVDHFVVDHRYPSGLRPLNPHNPLARLIEVRNDFGAHWKVSKRGNNRLGQEVLSPSIRATRAVKMIEKHLTK